MSDAAWRDEWRGGTARDDRDGAWSGVMAGGVEWMAGCEALRSLVRAINAQQGVNGP